MKLKPIPEFILKYLLAPIAVWAVTKSCDNRAVNNLQESVRSLDATIKTQRDSLNMANSHIDSLNAKWQKFQEIMGGVAIGGNVDSSIIIGTMDAGADDDALQRLKELQELLK